MSLGHARRRGNRAAARRPFHGAAHVSRRWGDELASREGHLTRPPRNSRRWCASWFTSSRRVLAAAELAAAAIVSENGETSRYGPRLIIERTRHGSQPRGLLSRVQGPGSRLDGRFLTGVLSTGVFCRPICPARTPRFENCVFFPTAAAAYSAGFRPCLRCRPEISPGAPAWTGTAATVNRALRLIAEEGPEATNLEALASRLGVGSRHLRRLFRRHVGASPVAVLQVQRVFLAKQLITDSGLPLSQVALGAGFGSIRRFNAVMKRTFGRPPRDLRGSAGSTASGLTLRLPYRPPYDWPGVLAFLTRRAIPGVESVDNGVYRRTISLDGAQGVVEIRATPEACLLATITVDRLPALAAIAARLRHLFDLEADPEPIAAHLGRDPALARRLAARRGLRVPGAWDAFELAVRAMLGQQVSVRPPRRSADGWRPPSASDSARRTRVTTCGSCFLTRRRSLTPIYRASESLGRGRRPSPRWHPP